MVGQDIVVVEDAAVSYGGRQVLGGVNLSVTPGERVAIIGPSGAGKTTLLRLLAGLLKPAQGRVQTLGHDRSEEHTSELQSLMRNSYAVFCLKKKKSSKVNIAVHNININYNITTN